MRINIYFSENDKLIEVFLRVMEVFFTTPSITFVRQGDIENQHIYMIGDGIVDVQRKNTNAFRDSIWELDCGSVLNTIAALFNCAPLFEYHCKSYCTLARIRHDDFSNIMKRNKPIKTKMVKKLFENPYEIDRNYFIL